jgi:UDP-N-acetylmuramyl pentapeptide phosphotransferase/UDP-N-acetylglucosamine-1-phosphate transferase
MGLTVYNHPSRIPPHKTFMGDCGSQFVGFALAVFAMHLPRMPLRSFSFVSALILLSPFAWDVCYTLGRRILRGENVLRAHRSHLYQRLLVSGWTHAEALALNAVLWTSCAALALLYESAGRSRDGSEAALVLLAVLALLAFHTLFVLWVERRAHRRAGTPAP